MRLKSIGQLTKYANWCKSIAERWVDGEKNGKKYGEICIWINSLVAFLHYADLGIENLCTFAANLNNNRKPLREENKEENQRKRYGKKT